MIETADVCSIPTVEPVNTLERLQSAVDVEDAGKVDELIAVDQMSMTDDGDVSIGSKTLVPSSHAFSQLCTRLRMPATYLRKCPGKIRAANVNFWLAEYAKSVQEDDRKWLLREKNSTLRAILSDRYTALDNRLLLTMVENLELPENEVVSHRMDDTTFQFRMVFPSVTRASNVGRALADEDQLFVGIHVANSEVGKQAVTIDPMLYRKDPAWGYGLRWSPTSRSFLWQKHVGTVKTKAADRVAHAFRLCVEAGENLMLWVSDAKNVPMPVDESVVKSISERFLLSENAAKEILESWQLEAVNGATRWALVNALMKVAENESNDKFFDLTGAAGEVLAAGRT